MIAGAGALAAFAAGAAAAGWWLLAGIAVAGLLGVLARGLGEPPEGLRLAAGLALLPLCGSVFAAYVLPGAPRWTAGVVVAVLVVVHATGLRMSEFTRRCVLGVLLAGAAALVAVSFAAPAAPPPALASPPGFSGVLLASAIFVPLFAVKAESRWWPGATVLVLVVLGIAVLHQLGPVRLGLDAASLRDVLMAAQASVLLTLLATGAALATVTGGLSALEELPEPPRWQLLAGGAVAAVLAALLTPFQALWLATVLVLMRVLVTGVLATRRREGGFRAPAVSVLGAVLLAAALLA